MTKILDASYFFVFSEPKSVIVLYIEIEKIWNTLFRQLILFFLSWRQRSVFIVMTIVKSQESLWSIVLIFVDSTCKKVL
jgi:hypothetical protein